MNFYWKCYKMRYILSNSDVRLLKYGNPDTPFLSKILLFLNFMNFRVKICGKTIFFIFHPILFQYNSEMTKKVYVNPVKISKFIFAQNPSNNLTWCWICRYFLIWDLKVPVFFIFLGISKNATLTQYFNYKLALFCHKEGSIGHKKFQRFQKWGQMSSSTLASGISIIPA